MKKETKIIILSFVGLILLLIMMNGMSIGIFHKTSDTMYNVWLVCWLILAAYVFFFFIRRKLFHNKTIVQKGIYALLLLMLAGAPSIPLGGIIGYIDYYTTNKQWKQIQVTVADIRGDNYKGNDYTYKLVSNDTVLYLDCHAYFKKDETLTLVFCTTRLGNVVANTKY